MKIINDKYHIYFDIKEKEEKIISSKLQIDEPASIIEVDNGIALPIRKKNEISNEGGITNSNGEFIAGFTRDLNNITEATLECTTAYTLDYKPVKIDETVIFGGVLFDYFGHFLRDAIVRLWYVIKNPNIKHKIIFLTIPGHRGVFENILNLMGIQKERYEIIQTATQFKKIIIPEQACDVFNGYKQELQIIFDEMIKNSKPSNLKKIYLSKSKMNYNTTINEQYFENFYKKRGFEIIYPETLPFLDQVSILNGADEIVCTVGTLVHLTFFCKNNAKLTVLSRTYDSFQFGALTSWLYSIQMRNLETHFVDVSNNFLPLYFINSTFFLGPTKFWIDYLNENKIYYEKDEISIELNIKPFIFDYLVSWANVYSNLTNYNGIKNFTLPDVINSIQKTFFNTEINTNKFPERDDVVKMQNYIKTDISELTGVSIERDLNEEVTQIIGRTGIQQNLQKFATQTQANFKGAQTAIIDLQNKNNLLNQKVNSLEQRIAELEKLLNKEQ